MTRDEVITIVKGMSPDDRAVVAASIWQDLQEDGDAVDIDDETWSELRRRIAAYEADPSLLLTWEQVKARLASRT